MPIITAVERAPNHREQLMGRFISLKSLVDSDQRKYLLIGSVERYLV